MTDTKDYSSELRSRRREQPFRPFVIESNSGQRLRVGHRFGFAMNVKGVIVPGEGGPVRFTEIVAIVDAPSLEARY